nr:acyl-CoA dehydrogenase family protein [Roseomonas acroporae]
MTDEQRLLKDSVDRMIEDAYGDFEKRKAYRAEPLGWSEALWKQYAELGLLGLPFEERHGGFGGGAVETMIVMEALGRGLAVEPYLATVILGGGFLRHGGSEAQQDTFIPRIAEGTLRLAFAQTERQARYDLFDIATTAKREGDGFVIDGEKGVVLHGDSADMLVVSARTSGSRRDREGITLFLVPADAAGVTRTGYPTQDGLRGAEIAFSNVRVGQDAVLGEIGQGLPLIERVVDEALAAVSAEAVGAMDALQTTTVDYLKTRQQFGTTIGSFQALQHRAADMLVALEQARSMAMYAAMMSEAADPRERRAAVAAAKVQINDSGRFVGEQSVQLHGGIAMTMEYKAGHYFKRLTMIENLFGDTEYQLRAVAEAEDVLVAD